MKSLKTNLRAAQKARNHGLMSSITARLFQLYQHNKLYTKENNREDLIYTVLNLLEWYQYNKHKRMYGLTRHGAQREIDNILIGLHESYHSDNDKLFPVFLDDMRIVKTLDTPNTLCVGIDWHWTCPAHIRRRMVNIPTYLLPECPPEIKRRIGVV